MNTPSRDQYTEDYFFICQCSDDAHTIRVTYDNDFKEVTFHVYLENKCWYKRIWRGILYIFGRYPKYGHFIEMIFDPKDCDEMIRVMQKLKENTNE